MPKLGVKREEFVELPDVPTQEPTAEAVMESPVVEQPIEALPTFEELIAPKRIEISAETQVFDTPDKLVEIRLRENVTRTRLPGGQWYTFQKGRAYLVPRSVRDWLDEQRLL